MRETTAHTITVIRGDGIGPEIIDAILPVIEFVCPRITWDIVPVDAVTAFKHGEAEPTNPLVASLISTRVAIKGPLDTPTSKGYRSANVRLREVARAHACIRPVRSLAGVPSRYHGVDLVIVRENLEDLYRGVEAKASEVFGQELRALMERHYPHLRFPDETAFGVKFITEEGSHAIIESAFAYAERHGRRLVTCVHKANIMKTTDGLFLRVFEQVASTFPNIEADALIADNAMQQLVLRPERFDVIVTENLYGDLLSDLAAGLVGGLGVCPGANMGPDVAIFEATHGTAPDIAGQNRANPTALLLSAAMMLEHLEEHDAARMLRMATEHILEEGRSVTPDIAHDHSQAVGTREMAEAIQSYIADRRAAVAQRLDEAQGWRRSEDDVKSTTE